jgi:hypothetical protein
MKKTKSVLIKEEQTIEVNIPSYWKNVSNMTFLKILDEKLCLKVEDLEKHFAPIDSIGKTYIPDDFGNLIEITKEEFESVYNKVIERLKF